MKACRNLKAAMRYAADVATCMRVLNTEKKPKKKTFMQYTHEPEQKITAKSKSNSVRTSEMASWWNGVLV